VNCPHCGRELKNKLALSQHLRHCQPKEEVRVSTMEPEQPPPDAFGMVRDLIRAEVEQQVKGMEERLTGQFGQVIDQVRENLAQQINQQVSQMGNQIITEIQSRLGEALSKRDPSQLLAALLPLIKSGGGADLSSFTQLGQAIGAILGPVVGIWSAGVSQGLQAVGYAQRMTSGQASPQQVAEEMTRASTEGIQQMMKAVRGEQTK